MAERLTLTEAAEFCGVHRNTVRGWVKAGRLDTARLEEGRAQGQQVWRVDADELREKGLVKGPAGPQRSDEVQALVEALRDCERRAARAEARLEELEELRAELEAARRETEELRRLVVRMELEAGERD